MVNVINNRKHYKVQRIEDKPTSASEQTRSERAGGEINTGSLEMLHTWTENSVSFKKDERCVCHTSTKYMIFFNIYFFNQ